MLRVGCSLRRVEDNAPYLRWVFGRGRACLSQRAAARDDSRFLLLLPRSSAGIKRSMDRPKRKRLPHDVPQWVPEGSFFFITIKCQPRGCNQLCRAGSGEAVLEAAAHYHRFLRWHCRLMLLMPDHLHAIIAFPREPGIKSTVKFWKRYLARFHRICWQRDFFDHRLRDHQELEKVDYILRNPLRWGLCERIEEWPWIYRPADRPPPKLGQA